MTQLVSAEDFWSKFKTEIINATHTGHWRQWSIGMFDVIHRVQAQFDVWCQCRAHPDKKSGRSGERMAIDFTWYANGQEEWVPALVAIEHENSWHPDARCKDHWKVNQIAAPLRVFIGYCGKEHDLEPAAQELQGREDRWFAVPRGESLLIMGHGEMELDGFRAWTCVQGRKDTWRELQSR